MGTVNKKSILLVVFALFTISSVFAQIPDSVISGIKSGNDKVLADYFNENIELVVPGHDDVFSKSQAQQLVNKFFKENPPESFTVLHQGGKDDSPFLIGTLQTSKGNFRVYLLLKTKGNRAFIHQLRIEKQG